MLEHQHANPILQVFVKLLVEIQDIKNKNKRCKVIAPFEEQCKGLMPFFVFISLRFQVNAKKLSVNG